jgi:large subunit ribosomal protein L4
MKAAALRGALSDRARGGNVHVLTGLVDGTAPSTKTARGALAAVSSARNVLVVLDRNDEAGWLSLRNLPEVHLLFADQLNTYDVLASDDVVFTKAALDEFLSFQRVQAADVSATTDAESSDSSVTTDVTTEVEVADVATGTDDGDTPVVGGSSPITPTQSDSTDETEDAK